MLAHFAMGYVPDRDDAKDRRTPLQFSLRQPAASVDLRPAMPAVIHQGDVGRCVGAALAAVIWRERALRGELPEELSPTALYYWARVRGKYARDQDTGCELRDACAVATKLGAPPERVWPLSTSFAKEPDTEAFLWATGYRVKSYHRVETLAELRLELTAGHPVIYGFMVAPNFVDVGGDGVFIPTSRRSVGGHAVVAVGYDAGRVLTRNSWGGRWGLGGHFWMRNEEWEDPDVVVDAWALRGA